MPIPGVGKSGLSWPTRYQDAMILVNVSTLQRTLSIHFGNIPHSHISKSVLANSAVPHSLCEVLSPIATHWHEHVESGIGTVNIMLSIPIQHHESFETKLGLENTVHKLAVLAAIGVVDAVVRAHDRCHASFNAVHEWPEVIFVQSLVIYIGRSCLNTKVRASIRFLFVGNEVLHMVSD